MEKYLNQLIELQNSLINYLDTKIADISKNEPTFCDLYQYLSENGFLTNKNYLKIFLRMLVTNSNNHFRSFQFNTKIDIIFLTIKDLLTKYYSNEEIFEIFHTNKILLLYLLESKLLSIDSEMNKKMVNEYSYRQFFQKYLTITDNNYPSLPIDAKLQKEGENHLKIAKIIREDNLNEFIQEIETTKIQFNSDIEGSIYESNEFFKDNLFPRYIEYAAFYGSINIFKYLCLNQAQFHPIIWKCAIHGRNYEIIHIIENQTDFHYKYNEHDDIEGNVKKAIKCHHNEIANYYYEHFCSDLNIDLKIIEECFHSFNISFLFENLQQQFLSELNSNSQSILNFLVANDYADFISILLSQENPKIECKPVLEFIFLMKFF